MPYPRPGFRDYIRILWHLFKIGLRRKFGRRRTMSIQRCEYEITTTRGHIQGEICTLTGRGCIITDLLQVDNCKRRLWAKQYQAKQASLDGPSGSIQSPPDQYSAIIAGLGL